MLEELAFTLEEVLVLAGPLDELVAELDITLEELG